MSHAYKPSYRHADHSHRPAGHRRQQPAAKPHRAAAAGDYTLGVAGRQVRLGPVAFWIVVGSLVIMGAWSITTATYFAFRDDVLSGLLARQAEMQFAYEDRIAEMRAQIDRITSRQLLDQDQFEHKLEQIMRRQTALESRASSLGVVADPTPTGSIRAPARNAIANEPDAAVRPKASPISDTVIFVAPPDREARLESRTRLAPVTRVAAKGAGVEGTIARLQASLDRIEAQQAHALNALEEKYDAKARRVRSVLSDLGLGAVKPPAAGAVGGPFVPIKPPSEATTFERQLYRIQLTRADLDRLTRTLVAVPIRKPLNGEIDTTSGFGVRIDPFLRAPAMHTGLDFRGMTGEPIRATAAGTVTVAGWNGGYGKMVEIDHGNGLVTRYGHLSAVEVDVGDKVRSGQLIGRLGSTGRSTGPHLHYETRVDGDAVDPQKFLRAGLRLGSGL
jgi:murein DD-endopeptidase MepM/ murein hydrolase activator NlpD